MQNYHKIKNVPQGHGKFLRTDQKSLNLMEKPYSYKNTPKNHIITLAIFIRVRGQHINYWRAVGLKPPIYDIEQTTKKDLYYLNLQNKQNGLIAQGRLMVREMDDRPAD